MEGPYSARLPSARSGRHPDVRPLTGGLSMAELDYISLRFSRRLLSLDLLDLKRTLLC